jgi:hypothetical protein
LLPFSFKWQQNIATTFYARKPRPTWRTGGWFNPHLKVHYEAHDRPLISIQIREKLAPSDQVDPTPSKITSPLTEKSSVADPPLFPFPTAGVPYPPTGQVERPMTSPRALHEVGVGSS